MSRPCVNTTDLSLHIPRSSRFKSTKFADKPKNNAAVFLDRDGLIIKDVNYLSDKCQIQIIPQVTEGLIELQDFFYLIIVTNQSGIARGIFTEQQLSAIHSELASRLERKGIVMDAIYYCPHLPDANVKKYRVECDCRKPNPGMLIRASIAWNLDLSRSYMLGDRRRDLEAGLAAGTRSILVRSENSDCFSGYDEADNLSEAAAIILNS